MNATTKTLAIAGEYKESLNTIEVLNGALLQLPSSQLATNRPLISRRYQLCDFCAAPQCDCAVAAGYETVSPFDGTANVINFNEHRYNYR